MHAPRWEAAPAACAPCVASDRLLMVLIPPPRSLVPIHRLSCVRKDLGVMRTKKVPTRTAGGAERPAFSRYVFDKHQGEVLVTDPPAAEFVVA